MHTELPIACTLLPDALARRLEDMRHVGRAALLDARVDDGHAELRFATHPGVRDRVEALAAAERRCCAFLRIDVRDGADATILAIDAPPGGEPVLAELVAAFRGDAA